VRGERKQAEDRKSDVLYQGIAARTFERRFQLADGVQVTGATLENGLLHIDLVREIPEAKKPRVIPIAGRGPATIEQKQAA
jgi:molecular chaperone IbpA